MVKKNNDFLERLKGKKNAAQENQTLFQFRFPKTYADRLKDALDKKGLKARDIFEAAAELLLEGEEEKKEETRTDKAKGLLRRDGPSTR